MSLLPTPPWPDEILIYLTSSWVSSRIPLPPCERPPCIYLHCSRTQLLSKQNRISPTLKARDRPSLGRKVTFTLMSVRTNAQTSESRTALLGRTLATGANRRKENPKPLTTHRDQPRVNSPINDNYFVNRVQEGLLAGSKTLSQDLTLNSVNCGVVKVVRSAPGHSQKKEISPGAAACQISENHKLKYVKGVSCVTHLSCVQPVINAQLAA